MSLELNPPLVLQQGDSVSINALVEKLGGPDWFQAMWELHHHAFLHFTRFLECLCLDDGALLFSDDVGDAVHWHQTMLNGQYR